jgi:hypothetical protein
MGTQPVRKDDYFTASDVDVRVSRWQSVMN